ncbi:MAG TPA: hypothetical protein VKA84_25050 [Gemmatimonadaceae bacterium]|nr:hypothetical protein [Gemmatimonadaceae bacterium]
MPPSLRRVGLSILAGVAAQALGAVHAARAQQPPPRPPRDTVRRDTTFVVPLPAPTDTIPRDSASEARRRRQAARDSAGRDTAAVRTDTIKAPLAHALTPVLADVGQPLYWDRRALFASGALTLLDLMERVPGLTGFRARWIGDPMFGAYLGDVARVRIFHDGVELDPLDVRTRGLVDLSSVQLWQLEDLAIERSASELRVYLRSWRYQRTTPNTRTDVLTGDEDTNIYRGFFARRFWNGASLQIAAQQWSASNRNLRGNAYDADALSLLSRVGWARGRWKADGFVDRTRRFRSNLPLGSSTFGQSTDEEIRTLDATETMAYLRAAFGDPEENGPWAQVIASTQGFKENSAHGTSPIPVDTVDTAVSRAQYVFTTGMTYRGVRLSAEDRLRRLRHAPLHSLSARASMDWRAATFSAFVERARPDTGDELRRVDLMARATLLPFLALSGAVGQVDAVRVSGATELGLSGSPQPYDGRSARAEVALRLRRALWVSGGVLARDSSELSAPVVLLNTRATPETPPVRRDRATGVFATVRGTLWKAIGADVVGVAWGDSSRFYRPKYQSRSELYLQTSWPRRFPSGNFNVYFGVTHEYRSAVVFPRAPTDARVSGSRVWSTLLELRLLQATLSWQFRNTRGDRYRLVPDADMPRAVSVYGVRWDFFN